VEEGREDLQVTCRKEAAKRKGKALVKDDPAYHCDKKKNEAKAGKGRGEKSVRG